MLSSSTYGVRASSDASSRSTSSISRAFMRRSSSSPARMRRRTSTGSWPPAAASAQARTPSRVGARNLTPASPRSRVRPAVPRPRTASGDPVRWAIGSATLLIKTSSKQAAYPGISISRCSWIWFFRAEPLRTRSRRYRASDRSRRLRSSNTRSVSPKPFTAARWMALRSVSSVLLPGSAGRRNCLVANGWTVRTSNPASAKARLTGWWYRPVRSTATTRSSSRWSWTACRSRSTAARNPGPVWGTSTGSIRTLPKKSASIHLDRALAQSTLTTPKCWGPTRSTRGCRAPAGLWTSCRRRPRRRRDRAETVMGWTSARGLAEQPRFSRGSQEMAPGRFLSQIGHIPADYVLALKGNQETLHQAVIDYIEVPSQNDFADVKARRHQTRETGHGRDETRRYIQLPVPQSLPGLDLWSGLKSVGRVESRCVRDGKETVEVRYYISSLGVSVKRFAHAIRSHWGIENSCQWSLDITYREDESRTRHTHLRENFAWLRRLTLSLLKQHPGRESVAMKRRSCGWSDDFMMEVLTGAMI